MIDRTALVISLEIGLLLGYALPGPLGNYSFQGTLQ